MTYKFPKSMAACADLLSVYRQERLDADKAAAELKSRESALVEHIINNVDKASAGAVGKNFTVRVVTKDKPVVKDWSKFYAYVQKHGAFELLQKRLGEKAIEERIDAGKKIPGVGSFTAVTVSLTKNPGK